MPKPNRLSIGDWGLEKRGKSSLALSFPRPMEYFDFDFGIETLDYEGEGFVHHTFSWSAIQDQEEMEQVLNSFLITFDQACHRLAGTGGSVAVDTMTQVDSLAQAVLIGRVREIRAKRETAKQGKKVEEDEVIVQAFDYGARNAMIQSIYTTPLSVPKLNAIFLHKAKPVYSGKDKTDKFEFAGWSGMPGMVRATVHSFRIDNPDGTADYMGEIQSSGYTYHPSLKVFSEPSYETLASIFGME